jgi:hypothetical protein
MSDIKKVLSLLETSVLKEEDDYESKYPKGVHPERKSRLKPAELPPETDVFSLEGGDNSINTTMKRTETGIILQQQDGNIILDIFQLRKLKKYLEAWKVNQ